VLVKGISVTLGGGQILVYIQAFHAGLHGPHSAKQACCWVGILKSAPLIGYYAYFWI